MKRCLATLVVVGAMLMPSSARAEIMVAPTLEWLADHCPDSGLYKVKRVTVHANKTRTVRLERTSALRGAPPAIVEHVVGTNATAKAGDAYLVALQRYKDKTTRPLQVINLTTPAKRGFSSVAVTSQLQVLGDRKSILAVFRARLKRVPKVDPVRVGDHSKDNRFELDPGMAPYTAIFGGSSCYLRIPADLVATAKKAARANRRKR